MDGQLQMEEQYNMKYYLAHNGSDVCHCIELEEGQVIETGQPYLEQFDTQEECYARMEELGFEIPEDDLLL